MDSAKSADVGLNGFEPAEKQMKLPRRHGIKLRLEFSERGGQFARGGQASKFLFHCLQLGVKQPNFRTKVFLARDVVVHRSQVERDVSGTTLVKVSGEHPKGRQTPLEQFQVLLHFTFHI